MRKVTVIPTLLAYNTYDEGYNKLVDIHNQHLANNADGWTAFNRLKELASEHVSYTLRVFSVFSPEYAEALALEKKYLEGGEYYLQMKKGQQLQWDRVRQKFVDFKHQWGG